MNRKDFKFMIYIFLTYLIYPENPVPVFLCGKRDVKLIYFLFKNFTFDRKQRR